MFSWSVIMENFRDFISAHYSFFSSVLVITLAIIFSRIVRKLLKRFFDSSSEHLNVDPTRYKFFRNTVDFIIFLIATILVFYTIPQLRTLGLTLFAGAGIFAAIVGFASQQAFSNIISGIFIVIFKPFRVNDVVKVGIYESGIVEDITLRHTVIRSFENRRFIIPNAVISEQVVLNSSLVDEHVCIFLDMNISFDTNIDQAMAVMQDECAKHPDCLDLRTSEDKENKVPIVGVQVIGLQDSAVNLRAKIWAQDAIIGSDMKCDLLKNMKQRFDREGIEIPYPHRTIVEQKKSSVE